MKWVEISKRVTIVRCCFCRIDRWSIAGNEGSQTMHVLQECRDGNSRLFLGDVNNKYSKEQQNSRGCSSRLAGQRKSGCRACPPPRSMVKPLQEAVHAGAATCIDGWNAELGEVSPYPRAIIAFFLQQDIPEGRSDSAAKGAAQKNGRRPPFLFSHAFRVHDARTEGLFCNEEHKRGTQSVSAWN